MMKRRLLLAAGLLALSGPAWAANLTPPMLGSQTSIATGDLFTVWPVASAGPLKAITWANVQTALGLGTAASANTGTSGGVLCLLNANCTFSGVETFGQEIFTVASNTSNAGLNIAPGVAPTTPSNGDCWITSSAFDCQIGGATRQFMVGSNNLSEITSASTARTNLGLGTAATVNTGTSGATVPLLNGPNVTFTNGVIASGFTSNNGAVVGGGGGWFVTGLGQGWGVRLAADGTNAQALLQVTNNAANSQWAVLSVSGSGQPFVSSTGFSGVMTNTNGSTAVTQAANDNSTDVATDAFVQTATPTATTSVSGLSPLATGAQVITGTDTTHSVTPASLTSAQNLASAGYDQLPGGLYIEWGISGSITNGGGSAAQTFNHACASAVYSVTITPSGGGGSGGQSYAFVSSVSTSGFTITNNASSSLAFYWQAICK